ncbi:MAG TPA: helix-turn-helix domain-containing protein [Desulfitobacteriaceae bacterium]|nr:helix-turn-helix domain-containing protein [Desulfitobacteriaceae bacterium]
MADDSHRVNIPDIKDLITFSQGANIAGLSDRHLRKLAAANEIWAMKLGRNWYTTEKAIKDYLAKGIKRGPKPKKVAK